MDTEIGDNIISVDLWTKHNGAGSNLSYTDGDGFGQSVSIPNDSQRNIIHGNQSEVAQLPLYLMFNSDSLISIVAYACLMFLAAVGNLTVFITLFRNRHRRSRVNMFIMHLAIADMEVTFVMIPIEISWHSTVQWLAGDASCRLLAFCRAFGFYLSSFILVAISLDRYFAIIHPLSMQDADKRAKIMLGISWCLAMVCSIPQSVIFHLEHHPEYFWYTQCVTYHFFPSDAHELAYNLFNFTAVYAMPLVVITMSYSFIIWEITKKTKQSREETTSINETTSRGTSCLRRSGVGNIERARIRTLKMTVMIVLFFVICWTPYYVISAWFWFDSESAKKVDSKIQRAMFLLAVSNSCINPVVYGMFSIDFKREFLRCCFKARRPQQTTCSNNSRGQFIFRRTSKSSRMSSGTNQNQIIECRENSTSSSSGNSTSRLMNKRPEWLEQENKGVGVKSTSLSSPNTPPLSLQKEWPNSPGAETEFSFVDSQSRKYSAYSDSSTCSTARLVSHRSIPNKSDKQHRKENEYKVLTDPSGGTLKKLIYKIAPRPPSTSTS
ncbi:gonadotropin-releasing hormone II receptor isoform X1 [Lingula anatina]|uniref:Gonadotropin-releasing hormone II receptor isoform X1 n=1 Tax=Lingula anatina TaxID=7574 RepID=A0A1S3HC41_LINAN|nr:gonadotropin-releasing hormone II receptor isoform X1 [Lingula anatina]XP_013383579.1 gonadotropin-releasing hormone II receptor isoform X1 [Lingula anatina]|eukprot:XP_013383578.1 gonadotropin-releasing hormone II receptor isoform X1 [Lingula anatina]